jgi:hypothetical protein
MATIQHDLAQGHGYAEYEVGTQVTAYQLAIRVALRYWSARTTSVQDRLAETIPSLLSFMHHLLNCSSFQFRLPTNLLATIDPSCPGDLRPLLGLWSQRLVEAWCLRPARDQSTSNKMLRMC